MKQTVLIIITEIDLSKRKQLEGILEQIRLDLYHNPYIPFASLSLLHFASFVIVDVIGTPPLLVFENNFDGEISGYLDELLSVAGNGLHQIYQCCTEYKSPAYDAQQLKQVLAAKVVIPNAYHIGNTGRAAKDIAGNRELREKLQAYLDQLFTKAKPTAFSAAGLRKNMQEFVQKEVDPELSCPLPPHQTLSERVLPWVNLVFVGLILFVLAVGLFPVTLVLLFILRRKEDTDPIDSQPPSLSHLDDLMKTENQISQNHLANITPIKPGTFRLRTLKLVLFAANLAARVSNKGKLSGIPSIHFAHWSVINDNQLLFLSNFDGSWISYLDDFIDKAATGLTGIWSNTQGFPYSRFLVMDGARDEVHFKAFARKVQLPSLVWYSAYADLTVQNIDKDSAIREDVLTHLSEADTKKWLNLF